MRIVHTSDLHLGGKNPKSIDALKAVLRVAESQEAELLTLGGDIFDSPADANTLRAELRDLFHESKVQILGIPGNHDGAIFEKGFDFGFPVAAESPYEEHPFGDVSIVAVPFSNRPASEVLPSLKQAATDSKTRILLLHCTLDLGFESSNFGDESEGRYFPVSRAALASLDYDFILAGHFHSKCQTIAIDEGCRFVYPGSPFSISKKETGKRHVVLVDTERRTIEDIELPTFYFDSLSIDIWPGHERAQIDQIKRWYQAREKDDCDLEVTVRGFVKYDEVKFGNQLNKAAPRAIIHNQTRDVRDVLVHPLYVRFKYILETEFPLEDRDDIDRMVMGAMSSFMAGGESGR